MFSVEFVTSTDNQVHGSLSEDYRLEQNYPNPFNPDTTIRYALPESSEVELTVFDVVGRKVAILVDSRQSAGEHFVTFRGDHLPSGLYIYRLIATAVDPGQQEQFNEYRTMTLTK